MSVEISGQGQEGRTEDRGQDYPENNHDMAQSLKYEKLSSRLSNPPIVICERHPVDK